MLLRSTPVTQSGSKNRHYTTNPSSSYAGVATGFKFAVEQPVGDTIRQPIGGVVPLDQEDRAGVFGWIHKNVDAASCRVVTHRSDAPNVRNAAGSTRLQLSGQ